MVVKVINELKLAPKLFWGVTTPVLVVHVCVLIQLFENFFFVF